MKNALVWGLALLLVIVLQNLQEWLPRPTLSDIQPDYDNIDYYLADFSLQALTDDGEVSHTIDGLYSGHWRSRNTSFIVAPRIQSYQQVQAETINHALLTADEAMLDHGAQIVKLMGDVDLTATQQKNGEQQKLQIQSSFLNYNLAQNHLSSDQAVKITAPGVLLQGIGLDAKLDEAYLRLNNNVRSTYYPSLRTDQEN